MSLYLARLVLDANHPQAKSEAMHPYELHRTICKAFDKPDEARILFRADTDRPGEVHVIVQSLAPPDWERLETKDGYIKAKDKPKVVELSALKLGMALRFRLRCRPCKRIGSQGSVEKGKRRGLIDMDDILAWLARKAQVCGFEILSVGFERVYWYESRGGKHDKALGGVQFDGILVVSDPDKLREAVRQGIGTQKAYGFGLLSLAPLEVRL